MVLVVNIASVSVYIAAVSTETAALSSKRPIIVS
jgi:hypothetical protein